MIRYLVILSLIVSSFGYASEFDDEEKKEAIEEQILTKEHTLQLGEQSIRYSITTGRIPIHNAEGKESARIFFMAFTKNDAEADRPLTFVFPGGPGGSSCPESICAFGPKRLPLTTEGKPKRPPYSLIDNPQTLLFETDLVYIDPIETGYSRIIDKDDTDLYHTVTGDMVSLSMCVSNYLSLFKRWNAPIFLSGSSYGTTRACGVGFILNAFFQVPIRGLILMGNALDLDLLFTQRDRYLPDCLLLPTFAATAWYHKRFRSDQPLKEVIDYARKFAYEEYAPIMAQPGKLTPHEKITFYERLAELIGLPQTTIEKYNGRISEEIFTTEFFSPTRKILGGLDSRYIGDQSSIKRGWLEEDPSYRAELKGLPTMFSHYLQTEVETQFSAIPYTMYTHQQWLFNLTDLMFYLRKVMIINPDLQIFSANGYYDCRTPFMSAEYCFEHLDLPENYQKNVEFKYYEAGHGLFFDAHVLKQLHGDLVDFYKK